MIRCDYDPQARGILSADAAASKAGDLHFSVSIDDTLLRAPGSVDVDNRECVGLLMPPAMRSLVWHFQSRTNLPAREAASPGWHQKKSKMSPRDCHFSPCKLGHCPTSVTRPLISAQPAAEGFGASEHQRTASKG
jgi:hypothetical protein